MLLVPVQYRPEFEVPEVGSGEAGKVDLAAGLPVLVVAVRGGAADELAR